MNSIDGRIRLDFRAEDPIFQQIASQIKVLIDEGMLKPGDQLPTVREMAIDLRINFTTVARAYRILDEQRLITTQRGRGTYVEESTVPGKVQDQKNKAGDGSAGKLVGLAQHFISEAARSGASVEVIEQVFQQQLESWKRSHPPESY